MFFGYLRMKFNKICHPSIFKKSPLPKTPLFDIKLVTKKCRHLWKACFRKASVRFGMFFAHFSASKVLAASSIAFLGISKQDFMTYVTDSSSDELSHIAKTKIKMRLLTILKQSTVLSSVTFFFIFSLHKVRI